MKLTEKEEKIARLALDKAAKQGEQASAANKLIESLKARGITVEDLIKETEVRTEYVYPEPPPDHEHWGYRKSYYQPTPEETEEAAREAAREAAQREEANRRARAQQAQQEAYDAQQAREEEERERVRKAAFAARPWYIRWAIKIGKTLGPYSNSAFVKTAAPNPAFEEKVNLVFGLILMILLACAVLTGIIGIAISIVQAAPAPCLIGLLVLFVGVAGYLRSRVD